MSRYLVRVVSMPSSEEAIVLGWLANGRVVGRENATHYYHPSGAQKAIASYRERHPKEPLIFWINDSRENIQPEQKEFEP